MQGLDNYNRFLERKVEENTQKSENILEKGIGVVSNSSSPSSVSPSSVPRSEELARRIRAKNPLGTGEHFTLEKGVTVPITTIPATTHKKTEAIKDEPEDAAQEPLPAVLPVVIARPKIPIAAMKPSRRPTMPMPAVGAESSQLPCWERLPHHVRLLAGLIEAGDEDFYDDEESRTEDRQKLIQNLLNPTMTLEEAATLLGVSAATVRRYTTKGILPCTRTVGQQRRFRLADVLVFLEQNGGARG